RKGRGEEKGGAPAAAAAVAEEGGRARGGSGGPGGAAHRHRRVDLGGGGGISPWGARRCSVTGPLRGPRKLVGRLGGIERDSAIGLRSGHRSRARSPLGREQEIGTFLSAIATGAQRGVVWGQHWKGGVERSKAWEVHLSKGV